MWFVLRSVHVGIKAWPALQIEWGELCAAICTRRPRKNTSVGCFGAEKIKHKVAVDLASSLPQFVRKKKSLCKLNKIKR